MSGVVDFTFGGGVVLGGATFEDERSITGIEALFRKCVWALLDAEATSVTVPFRVAVVWAAAAGARGWMLTSLAALVACLGMAPAAFSESDGAVASLGTPSLESSSDSLKKRPFGAVSAMAASLAAAVPPPVAAALRTTVLASAPFFVGLVVASLSLAAVLLSALAAVRAGAL